MRSRYAARSVSSLQSRIDLTESDRTLNNRFNAHLIPKLFHIFRMRSNGLALSNGGSQTPIEIRVTLNGNKKRKWHIVVCAQQCATGSSIKLHILIVSAGLFVGALPIVEHDIDVFLRGNDRMCRRWIELCLNRDRVRHFVVDEATALDYIKR